MGTKIGDISKTPPIDTTAQPSDISPPGEWANYSTETASPTCLEPSPVSPLSLSLNSSPDTMTTTSCPNSSTTNTLPGISQPLERPGKLATTRSNRMLPVSKWAQAKSVKRVTAIKWCQKGLLNGAIKMGLHWHIPADTQPPPANIGVPPPGYETWVPMRQFAKMRRLPYQRVRQWALDNEIPALQIGSFWFVDPTVSLNRSKLLATRRQHPIGKDPRKGPLMMKVAELAIRTGISISTIRSWIVAEKVPAMRGGVRGAYYVDLRKILREHRDSGLRSQLLVAAEQGLLGHIAQRLVGAIPDDEVW